jgi:hypothetical protein
MKVGDRHDQRGLIFLQPTSNKGHTSLLVFGTGKQGDFAAHHHECAYWFKKIEQLQRPCNPG